MAVDPNIQEKANDIRMKIYGEQVRESLASGLEAMSSDVVEVEGRQDEVESQFQDVIENTTDKDVVSAPEIIAARNGEANLKIRLDKENQEVTAQLAQTDDDLKSRAINVLHAPVGLSSAVGDGVTDDAPAINAIIEHVGGNGGGTIVFPQRTYALESPIIVDYGKVTLEGKKANIITLPNFDTEFHKGIIESLATKNGVRRPSGSIEETAIKGFHIDGEDKNIIGIAVSGFTRGCEISGNYVENCYHGIAVSGSWSSRISNNLVYNCKMGGLVLGKAYDIIIDTNMNYTDNGSDETIPQEGYEYSTGNVSKQCNAMEITHNTFRSNKNNLMVHFGNANIFNNNTLENPSNANMIISALESGTFISNYMEGSIGSVFGRQTAGIVSNSVWHGNFYNNENFFFLGFTNNDFTNNEIIGNYDVIHHTFQRVNGNTTQLPNPSFKADTSPFKPSYQSQRDDVVSDDVISHGGKLTTALEDTKLVTGLEIGEYSTETDLLKPSTNFHGYKLEKSKVIGQTPVSVGNVSRSGLFIVEGSNTENNSERFIDVLLVISFGSFATISSHKRGSNMATRSYEMEGATLTVSFSSKSYDVRSTIIGL